jgi:fused signal recognition particle receptor
LAAQGRRVVLAAGDTFRAAAVEQLRIWADRTGATLFAKETGADAAAVAYEAIDHAVQTGADVVLIDTAGRLHNKANLMDELTKIHRVIAKIIPAAPHVTILTLDATTGQNALAQVEMFQQAVPVTGLVVTKLDGSAKGGVVVALAERFKLPIYAVGVGEGADDLHDFNADDFAKALVT